MEKEDFRTVDDTIRSSYRKKAIALIKKRVKKGEVADLFGVNKNTVSNWWKNYETSGNSGYKSKKKGVKSEDKKLLSIANEKAIQLMIIDKMPDQLKLDYGLWTRKAVK
ncbi:helix-turn-helix domain-containing protein, partial [Lutibacter sp.]|uniref:helix-turn-helix domain-containing protein n=1 Tax=Lutibacter sp. TaxID=1925666 RepID=UPI00273717C6